MTKAETIEALLSPSLRVSRPVAACARCRSAKIKCDGKLPACTACERSGKASTCSGANDEFARGKERSYVAALEAASERLQRRIVEAKSGTLLTPISPGNTLDNRLPSGMSGNPSVLSRTISGTRRKEASVVDELVGDLGFLSVNATARDFHGFTSTMSFARILLSASMAADLPRFGPSNLPPRYVTTPLIQHYLDNIFVLMPFFSETELMSSVSKVYEKSGRLARPLDHWCVLMVLAVSAGSQSQSRGDQNHELALRYVAAALEHAEDVLHPGSIVGVQAVLLLVQYSLIDPEHFRSWYLIGMASRLMVDLGIHVEPAADLKISKHALDMRRKVFYCVYALDRTISMSLERSFAFTDDSAPDVQLPSISADNGKPESASLFLRSLKPSLYLFDIRRVQSAFYQTTRCSSRAEFSTAMASDYTSSITSDIQSWYSTIPATLSQRHVLYFRLESLYSQIFAIAPCLRIPLSQITDLNRTRIYELTLQFIDQMQPVIQDTNWHAFLTYTDICRVKFVGRQFLDVLWSNFDQLLLGGVPHSPQDRPSSGGASLASPILLSTSPLDNCTRIIGCIRKTAEILDYAKYRWGISTLREKFEQESAVMLGKLKSRQQELSNISQGSGPTIQTDPFSNNPLAFSVGTGSVSQGMFSFDEHQAPDGLPILSMPYDPQNPTPTFFRSSSSGSQPQEGRSLPQGSLPRRSYEFYGRPSADPNA